MLDIYSQLKHLHDLSQVSVNFSSKDLPIMNKEVTVYGTVFYLIVLRLFWPSKGQRVIKPSMFWKGLILIHNMALAVYSIYTFYRVFPTILKCITENDTIDDLIQCSGLTGGNMIFWNWTFYLSKYYEFIDTFILIFRNIKPSFLQVFHHTGAVYIMWAIIYTDNPGTWIFTVFNSFIHSIMYTYYCITVIGYKPRVKPLVTFLQLTQFVVGMLVLYPYWSSGLFNQEMVYAGIACVAYTIILIVLFMNFAYKTYISPNRNKINKRSKIKEA